MDIEGAEYWALLGMASLINRSRVTKILTEFAPHSLREAGIEPEKHLNLLAALGFRLYDCRGCKGFHQPIEISQFLNTYMKAEHKRTNLLCMRT